MSEPVNRTNVPDAVPGAHRCRCGDIVMVWWRPASDDYVASRFDDPGTPHACPQAREGWYAELLPRDPADEPPTVARGWVPPDEEMPEATP
jgi:hypothetical protein